nr:unnamed protein product [Callosobruchus chinensis]
MHKNSRDTKLLHDHDYLEAIKYTFLNFGSAAVVNKIYGHMIYDEKIQGNILMSQDRDMFDPDMLVETLNMLDDFTCTVDMKIEECVFEWNLKNTGSRYLGQDVDISAKQVDISVQCEYCMEKFATSESKMKHECLCSLAPHLVINTVRLDAFPEERIRKEFKTSELELKHGSVCSHAPRLVIELRREDADIQPKRQRKNAVHRELAACWDGIDQQNASRHIRRHENDISRTKNPALSSDKPVLICYHCNYEFYSKHTLRHHLMRYLEKKTEYRCKKCSFTAYSRTTLIMHRNTKHNISKRYDILCAHCPSMFFDKISLDEHVIRRHSEYVNSVTSKVHKCETCSYQSTYKSHLREHRLTHSKVYPYKCKICGYRTTRKCHLTRHIESHGMSITSYRNLGSKGNNKLCSQ